jgi:hypothetical protein
LADRGQLRISRRERCAPRQAGRDTEPALTRRRMGQAGAVAPLELGARLLPGLPEFILRLHVCMPSQTSAMGPSTHSSRRSARSVEIAALPLTTRDRATRVSPSCCAASVTVRPSAGRMSSRMISPGWGGSNMEVSWGGRLVFPPGGRGRKKIIRTSRSAIPVGSVPRCPESVYRSITGQA